MENRLKLRISRIFHASLRSCTPGNPEDIAEEPVFIAKRDSRQPSCPKSRVLPSKQQIATVVSSSCGCRHTNPVEKTSIIPGAKDGYVRCRNKEEKRQVLQQVMPAKLLERRRFPHAHGDHEGRICPPVSPVSPANSCLKLQEINKKKKDKKKNEKGKKTKMKGEMFSSLSFSSLDSGWFTSEEEGGEEIETLFSSKSLSSDSSEFLPTNRIAQSEHRKKSGFPIQHSEDNGFIPPTQPITSASKEKFRESIAVVKRSRDPYNDFRSSMVEMIIQKQIFEAMDLEELLHCFLSLNSSYHHQVIVEVFTEIWEVLFCN